MILLCVIAATPARAASKPEVSAASGFMPGLSDQHGTPITKETFLGKPAIVHFGFTHCPEVCPTTLNAVATLMAELGVLADQLSFVFITVDPERDTAGVLKEYIGYFDKRIIGVTGTQQAIATLVKSFGASHAKRPYDGGYSMDHVIFAYLKDSRWQTTGTLYLGAGANQRHVKQKIKALLPNALPN